MKKFDRICAENRPLIVAEPPAKTENKDGDDFILDGIVLFSPNEDGESAEDSVTTQIDYV